MFYRAMVLGQSRYLPLEHLSDFLALWTGVLGVAFRYGLCTLSADAMLTIRAAARENPETRLQGALVAGGRCPVFVGSVRRIRNRGNSNVQGWKKSTRSS